MPYALLSHDIPRTSGIEPESDGRRWTGRGSLAFVAAWLVGLAVKPVGVTSVDSAVAIADNYAEQRVASVVQILLVHAAAAIALLVFAVGLARFAESSRRTRAARWCRRTASVVALASLVQAVLGLVMIATAGSVASSTTRGLLIGVERLDALKLVALAGLCGAGVSLARRGLLARWTGRVAAGAIVCLLSGAVALAGVLPALAPMTVLALVLLLIWVGAVGYTTRRTEA